MRVTVPPLYSATLPPPHEPIPASASPWRLPLQASKLAMWLGTGTKLKVLDLRGNDLDQTRATNLFGQVGEQVDVRADPDQSANAGGIDDADGNASAGSAPDDSNDGSMIEFGDMEATETIRAVQVEGDAAGA